MIGRPDDELTGPLALARQFAALSGAFEPRALLKVLGTVSANVVIAVTADLAEASDTQSGDGTWLLRASVRQRALDGWASSGELDRWIEWRRQLPRDDATKDLLDALLGAGRCAPDAVRATIDSPSDREMLNRIALALERAGPHAPAYGELEAVRSALGRLDARSRAEAMLGRGFFGRRAELAQIAEWLTRPAEARPAKTLFVTGLPGTGKSTLIDEAARRASSAEPPWLVVRLDFDRSALDVQDRVGLALEISRQVAIALGDEASRLSRARLVAAGATLTSGPDVKGEGRDQIPPELSGALGEDVGRSGRPVLMLLDTMEVLRGRGETHPGRLFDCLDEFLARGLRPMAVLSAGRGDALDGAPDRIGSHIELTGLDPVDADALLGELQVPSSALPSIRELADGNPLVLRLAAMAVRDAGPGALAKVRGQREVAAAYLYRFLLSRIANPTLRRLAQPGLVVRRINAEVIAEVLAPQLKLGKLEPGEAVSLFDALSTHHWLVEPDATPGWVRHRSDIRTVLLRLLYGGGSKATAARVDRAAAKWFAMRTEPFAAIEAAYHQLQAMRWGGERPDIDRQVLLQFDAETIGELPEDAQDLVRAARGERTSKFRQGRQLASSKSDKSGEADESADSIDLAAAASELEALLERGDIVEAAYVYDHSFARQHLEPESPEAAIAVTFLWRAGRWTEAKSLAQQPLYLGGPDGATSRRERSPLVALAQLEIWAETRFDELVHHFKDDSDAAGRARDLRERGIKGSLANGALAFALLTVGVKGRRSTFNLEDPVEAAVAAWGGEGGWPSGESTAGRRLADALAIHASRFQSLVSPRGSATKGDGRTPRLPDPSTPASAARLLASSTPYGSVAEALRQLDRTGVLSHISWVDFEISERDGLPLSGAGDWSVAPAVSPEGSVPNLAALGFLAEWLGAAAFVLRHPDLGRVAQSAERWRRTTAGDWAYPEPPTSTWARRPDATTAERIDQLLSAEDPQAASRDLLALWWGPSRQTPADLAERIRRRSPAAIREARVAARRGPVSEAAARAAVALQAHYVPAAFVPPMAVLISADHVNGRRTS